MLFSTELRGRAAANIRQPTPIRSIQHPGPASNILDAIWAPGGEHEGRWNPPYDQTSPVIGSAVAALFAFVPIPIPNPSTAFEEP